MCWQLAVQALPQGPCLAACAEFDAEPWWAGHQHSLALQVLATATEEGNILLWQLPLQPAVPLNGSEPQELQPVVKLQGHAAKVFNVAWSPLLKVRLVAFMDTMPAQIT